MTVFENVAFPLRVAAARQRPAERTSRSAWSGAARSWGSAASPSATATEAVRRSAAAARARPRARHRAASCCCSTSRCRTSTPSCASRMRFELKRLQRELGVTSIYVTHDQTEALAMSQRHRRHARRQDRADGQAARDLRAAARPSSSPTSSARPNFAVGPRAEPERRRLRGRCRGWPAPPAVRGGDADGREVSISIRPEAVELHTQRPADLQNVWEGVVGTRAFLGDAVDHLVSVDKMNSGSARCPTCRCSRVPRSMRGCQPTSCHWFRSVERSTPTRHLLTIGWRVGVVERR